MQNFDWNDGLSVGIESIDNDHKKLLSLINELSNAILKNHASNVIENVFLQLEEYVVVHFEREEALMEKCHYPGIENHIKQHQIFIQKVPELKYKLLKADSAKICQEVNVFLYDWLMNHIIGEDLDFTQYAYEANLSDEKPRKFKGISNWLTEHIVLRARLALTALLPLVTLFALSFLVLWSAYKEFVPVQQQFELIPLVHQINSLSHNLQIERGLSVAFLASKDSEFYSRLTQQYIFTDKEIIKYKQEVESIKGKIINKTMREEFTLEEHYFSQLLEQRKVIEAREVDSTLTFYTGFIASLLELTESLHHQKMTYSMVQNFTAIKAILNLKETMGLERAIGSLAIEQGYLSKLQLRKFIQLIGQKKGFLKSFHHAATEKQLSQFKLGCEEQNISILEQEILLSILENEPSKLKTHVWFDLLSCEINQLKIFTEFLIKDLTNYTISKVFDLRQRFYIIASVLLAIFTLTFLMFFLLKRSITIPLGRLTHALHDLAFGTKKVMLKDKFTDDELGELLKSYEKCRRRLLQIDISSSINFMRLGLDLDEKILEKKHYEKLSSIDPLTGAFNRRKLNELAILEIERIACANKPLSVMMLDIDFFKKINDTYGHAVGDKVLIAFYQSCQRLVRNIDIVARIGGEEFVILMPETDLQQASEVAERIRSVIEQQVLDIDNKVIKHTVSIGVVTWGKSSYKNFDDFLHDADQQLYEAKESGRNCVIIKF